MREASFARTLPTPAGPLRIHGEGGRLTRIEFVNREPNVATQPEAGPAPAPGSATAPAPDPATGPAPDEATGRLLDEAERQLTAYFRGERTSFELPLAPTGTPFQEAVWGALRTIPPGETLSYGALAARIDRPGAARAVGSACGRNPLPIVVPCHRVVGSNGHLGGFGGGLDWKRYLLALEAAPLPDS